MAFASPFTNDVAQWVWERFYRYRDNQIPHDHSVQDTWRRVAAAIASIEPAQYQSSCEQAFYNTLENFKFLPGGRILAGCGTRHQVTLFNCFVMGTIEDSMEGIFTALKEGALTMQQGGGIGYDFSTLRPKGMLARKTHRVASGPVSFMHNWDEMCQTVLSSGNRRGAMMATLRCDHPDIEAFIAAKKDKRSLRNFNLSVLISDEFMHAVQNDNPWPLVFPKLDNTAAPTNLGSVNRQWSGSKNLQECVIIKQLPAKKLWDQITRANYDYAEPGVLFIDRINQYNNLNYCEQICATNPCGEVPLPPYGACNLGSLNLTTFIQQAFTPQAHFDDTAFAAAVSVAVQLLDNVIDLSEFPLQQQKQQALASRRIGLGITGLADAFIMLGYSYGDSASIKFTEHIMKTLCHEAYRASIKLAIRKGAFPLYDAAHYLQAKFIRALPGDITQGIKQHGIRNSHLIAIAPTGSISLLANNVSSGIEPVYNFEYYRNVIQSNGDTVKFHMQDYAVNLWHNRFGNQTALPAYFVSAQTLLPEQHINVQAIVQKYVDNAVSKTINVPLNYRYQDYQNLFLIAYRHGLKGCTTYRPNPITGEVLSNEPLSGDICCTIEPKPNRVSH